jgi:hypothetical protein
LKKYLSAFVCGFGAGVLQIVPVAKSFSCCLIIPAAAFLALVLEQKSTNNFTRILPGKAILIGLVTGLYAAIFGSFFDILKNDSRFPAGTYPGNEGRNIKINDHSKRSNY